MTKQQVKFKQWLIEWKDVIAYHTFDLTTYNYTDKASKNRFGYDLIGFDYDGNALVSIPTLPTEFVLWIGETFTPFKEDKQLSYEVDNLYKVYLQYEEVCNRNLKIDSILK